MQIFRGGFMLVMTALGIYGTLKFMNAKDGASWIQCIWSVIAVFLAIIAPQFQADAQAGAEYRRQKKLLREITLSAEVLLQAGSACGADHVAAGAFISGASLARWQAARDALASFPVTGLREAQEVSDLMAARATISEGAEAIQRAQSGVLAWVGATETMARVYDRDSAAFNRLTATV
jgi:hypothetical protein